LLPAGAFAGWGSHPLESAAFSRRTQIAVIRRRRGAWVKGPKTVNHPHQVGVGELLSYGFDQASG
jgi:hypothetical protein